MTTQGSKYVAPKRIRIYIPMEDGEKADFEYLAWREKMSASSFMKALVLEGLKIWEGK